VGVDQWIAMQLEPSRIRDTAGARIVAALPTLGMSSRELFDRYPLPQVVRAQMRRAEMTRADSLEVRRTAQESRRVLAEMQIAKVARAVASERQLEEVLLDFWENHFTVFAGKGPERYFIAAYEREAIRPHALGKFRDLLGAVAKSPAMLFYLDNWQSSVEEGRPVRATGCETSPFNSQSAVRNPQSESPPRTQRELRPRAPRASHSRRGRWLHAAGHRQRRARVHGVDAGAAAPERRVHLPAGHARCR
jgi:hypothetical protein